MEKDNRQSVRKRTLLGGKIVFNNGSSVVDCMVRNISDTGALLKVQNPLHVPADFTLHMSDGEKRNCTVVRRSSDSVGVRFC